MSLTCGLLSRGFITCVVTPCSLLAVGGAFPHPITLVADADAANPIRHGLDELSEALHGRGIRVEQAASWREAGDGIVVVAGLGSGEGEASRLLSDLNLLPPSVPESLLIRRLEREGKRVLLLVGADLRGLMYALLDVADRVGWATSAANPFAEVRDTEEKPYTPERALSVYTFNRRYWETRFYDESYWARYLDLLARNRFNSLVVIFGYENGGFLAPCYPYFFDVEGFPEVRMVGITSAEQQRNLAALNRLIQMAHDRGLQVTVGIWDHIYRGGVQGGGIPGADQATQQPTPGLVWGLNGDNLMPYTKAALAKFVRLVPDLDGIQFRMHNESGLKRSEQEAFWRDVFVMMRQKAPDIRLDLRAKELPDSVIQTALDTGVPFRITTKYWMEQMGLPFHPTHINRQNQFDRRHGYADLLRYPQRYRIHWRLWNGGTARVLLWGDPDYVRRFAASTLLYAGDGFEVNEPLCTKMEAQPHDAQPFDLLSPGRRYYDYEFERYWYFYQVFGRVGYNPDTPAEVWQREFQERFGQDAAPFIEKGLHLASGVLPRIVASCHPYRAFPMTRGWAEKQRLGDLPEYAKAEGSDIQLFVCFDEEARLLVEGGETAKVRPAENSGWFAQTAADIDQQVAQAERRIGEHRNREFESTVTDLRILSNLARFHSRRIPAAVNYRLFERTGDPRALDAAIAHERSAIEAWRQLVEAAGDFYTADLMMGVSGADLCGHWKDELALLNKGLEALEQRQREPGQEPFVQIAPRFPPVQTEEVDSAPEVIHQPVTMAAVGQPLSITAVARDPEGVKWVRLRYRHVNQQEDYRSLPMLPLADGDRYQATVPAQDVVSAWDLMYFIEVMDRRGNGRIHPDLNQQTPYFIVHLQR